VDEEEDDTAVSSSHSDKVVIENGSEVEEADSDIEFLGEFKATPKKSSDGKLRPSFSEGISPKSHPSASLIDLDDGLDELLTKYREDFEELKRIINADVEVPAADSKKPKTESPTLRATPY